MKKRRQQRVNSLLKEVIAEVIQKEVSDPDLNPFISVTKVEITSDFHYAKVYVSIIGSNEEKQKSLKILETASGFIGKIASKKIVIRYFPSLSFKLDCSVEEQLHMETILNELKEERLSRQNPRINGD